MKFRYCPQVINITLKKGGDKIAAFKSYDNSATIKFEFNGNIPSEAKSWLEDPSRGVIVV